MGGEPGRSAKGRGKLKGGLSGHRQREVLFQPSLPKAARESVHAPLPGAGLLSEVFSNELLTSVPEETTSLSNEVPAETLLFIF